MKAPFGFSSGIDGCWFHSKLSHGVFKDFYFICTLTGILVVHVAQSFHGAEPESHGVAVLAPAVFDCSVIAGLQLLNQVVEQENLGTSTLKLAVFLQDEGLNLLCICHLGKGWYVVLM